MLLTSPLIHDSLGCNILLLFSFKFLNTLFDNHQLNEVSGASHTHSVKGQGYNRGQQTRGSVTDRREELMIDDEGILLKD